MQLEKPFDNARAVCYYNRLIYASQNASFLVFLDEFSGIKHLLISM